MTEIYYRYEGYAETKSYGVSIVPSLFRFRVIKKTPCGAWITDTWDHENQFKRFVLDGDGKRFAYPTKQAAWNSYKIRKKRQRLHLENQLKKVNKCLEAIKDQSEPPECGAYTKLD